ncbi:MAG: putative motility protein [Gammaproteobacteria bacterium]|nr:putative motility protein [Gammaproteobacteria bacterium]MCP5196642.1 putative motility protein [Gammaproteobacteria bacterium]
MEILSIGAISAWQQQQTALQIEMVMLKKAMDLQTESALTLLQAVVQTSPATPATISVATPTVSASVVGRNIDVVV